MAKNLIRIHQYLYELMGRSIFEQSATAPLNTTTPVDLKWEVQDYYVALIGACYYSEDANCADLSIALNSENAFAVNGSMGGVAFSQAYEFGPYKLGIGKSIDLTLNLQKNPILISPGKTATYHLINSNLANIDFNFILDVQVLRKLENFELDQLVRAGVRISL